MLLGKPLTEGDLVFSHLGGAPIDPQVASRAFRRLARSLNLPTTRFHDLRHTHATLLFQQGVHPKIVSERLGHGSVAYTLDIYSHVVPGLQEAAARRFDEMLPGVPDGVVEGPVNNPSTKSEDSNGGAYGIRTRGLRLERAVSLATRRMRHRKLAGDPGFEPGLPDPESGVLPLD